MSSNKKEKIVTLLKGIETGDPESVKVVNEAKYIQHNPQTHEGSEGLASLFKRLSKTSPKVNIVRVFEDGDYVFAHTEYDFSQRNIGFEVFRFEDGQAVEHWDNIQKRKGPNASGHFMVDGETEITGQHLTESNRNIVQSFIKNVMIDKQVKLSNQYIEESSYIEHSPNTGDDISGLLKMISKTDSAELLIDYQKCHRLLADGNFVLSVCEGFFSKIHSSFYDLFRLKNGKIVEHWDTREAVPAKELWKNKNGKF